MTQHKRNVLTFALAIGLVLGLLVLVTGSLCFSIARRRRRAAARERADAERPAFVPAPPVSLATAAAARFIGPSSHAGERHPAADDDGSGEYDLHGLGHVPRTRAPAGALEPSPLMRARAPADFVPRFFAPEPEPVPPPPYGLPARPLAVLATPAVEDPPEYMGLLTPPPPATPGCATALPPPAFAAAAQARVPLSIAIPTRRAG
jgi:hypothetical protein